MVSIEKISTLFQKISAHFLDTKSRFNLQAGEEHICQKCTTQSQLAILPHKNKREKVFI